MLPLITKIFIRRSDGYHDCLILAILWVQGITIAVESIYRFELVSGFLTRYMYNI